MSRIKSFYPYFRDILFAILIIFFLPLKADVVSLEDRMTSLEGKMTSLEGKMTSLEGRMTSVEGRMTSLEGKVISFEEKMAEIMTDQQKQVSDLNARTDTHGHRIGNLENLRIAHNTDLQAHSE